MCYQCDIKTKIMNNKQKWNKMISKIQAYHVKQNTIPIGTDEMFLWASTEINALQAKIDELMFEYCPNEMTTNQLAEYKKHVKSIDSVKLENPDPTD